MLVCVYVHMSVSVSTRMGTHACARVHPSQRGLREKVGPWFLSKLVSSLTAPGVLLTIPVMAAMGRSW